MSASEGERAVYLQKQASYARITAMLRPNRGVGRFAPPPIHLPPRKKMRARAA